MNSSNGQADLVTLIDIMARFADLGNTQRIIFKDLISGKDMNGDTVAKLSLIEFADILADLLPYLNNKEYTQGLLDKLYFLRYGYIEPYTEKDYY